MFGLGWPELLLILAVLLLLFGATRLPKLSRSAGQSIKEFKKGMGEDPSANSKSNSSDKKKS